MPTPPTTPLLRFDGRPVGPRVGPPPDALEEGVQLFSDGRSPIELLETHRRRAREPRRRRLRLTADERQFLRARTPRLTPREHDVLLALLEGGNNEQIAHDLGIALPTLRSHLARISQKMSAKGRADLLRSAVAILFDGYRTGGLTFERA